MTQTDLSSQLEELSGAVPALVKALATRHTDVELKRHSDSQSKSLIQTVSHILAQAEIHAQNRGLKIVTEE